MLYDSYRTGFYFSSCADLRCAGVSTRRGVNVSTRRFPRASRGCTSTYRDLPGRAGGSTMCIRLFSCGLSRKGVTSRVAAKILADIRISLKLNRPG
eukprot:scaffold612299_cov46-Prasinocladus_malaysianus.AAC.1